MRLSRQLIARPGTFRLWYERLCPMTASPRVGLKNVDYDGGRTGAVATPLARHRNAMPSSLRTRFPWRTSRCDAAEVRPVGAPIFQTQPTPALQPARPLNLEAPGILHLFSF